MVLVGIIARTHGIRGEVILKSETDFPEERFKEGATLYARIGTGPIEALQVTSVRFQQGRPILGLAGISSIDEAERLADGGREGAGQRTGSAAGRHVLSPPAHRLRGIDAGGDEIGRVTSVGGTARRSGWSCAAAGRRC